MNFFEHQRRARRASAWLGVAFGMTVALVLACLNFIVGLLAGWFGGPSLSLATWFGDGHWLWFSALLLTLILFGSWRRLRVLWGHGDLLALRIGADNIAAATGDPQLRRLVNVTEEMALAAGLPAPTLWILSAEPGINAFVAGTTIETTALVVTRGAVEALDRDELQGVVAHEFGHVFSGDMRLNLQLAGVVAGLENLSQSGLLLLRLSHRLGARVFPLAAVIGLLLFAIGSLGWLGGRLLRAGFSRQREFLADASAVRYTRNPQGLAAALARIRDHAEAAVIRNVRVEEISHFCFALPLRGRTARWLASHPPLQARISRIDRYFELKQRSRSARESAATTVTAAPFAGPAFAGPVDAAQALPLAAAGMLAAVPEPLQAAARSQAHAPALACALLLAADTATRQRQFEALAEGFDAASLARIEVFGHLLGTDVPRLRLPLLQLALPQLRRQSTPSLDRLRRVVTALSAADGRLGLFEMLVLAWLQRLLRPASAPASQLRSFDAVGAELNLLFWALIRLQPGEPAVDAEFLRRLLRGFLRQPPPLPASDRLAAVALQRIGARLNQLVPMLKQAVLQACADCVGRDGELQCAEVEMLQAIALLLQAPVWPLSLNASAGPRPRPEPHR